MLIALSKSMRANPRINILGIGDLIWENGYEYALDAVSRLCGQGIEVSYHIIGSGAYSEAVHFCIHQMKLANVSVISDGGSRMERQQLQWCDVLVDAAVAPRSGHAILAGIDNMRPVVCSNVPDLPGAVVDGDNGFVVARRDPAALAARLEILARDRRILRRLTGAAKGECENVLPKESGA